MLKLEDLYYFTIIYEKGTLSSAAKALNISQPVLSRAMQNLESELGVSLFNRTKNKITINENGLYAIDYAKRILQSTQDFKTAMTNYNKSSHTISIGSCAPGPNRFLISLILQFYQDQTVTNEIKDIPYLIQGLKDHSYTMITMPYPSDDEAIESIPLMQENLFFSIPHNHPLSSSPSLHLKDLDGETMLLMSHIGFWHDMHKKTMPHTTFLIQQDRTVFFDLVHQSDLPSFCSDYMMSTEDKDSNRIIIPIIDKEAHVQFHCWYLKENENKLKSFLYTI